MVVVAIQGNYVKPDKVVKKKSIVASKILKTMNEIYTVSLLQPGKTYIDSMYGHLDADLVMESATDKLIFKIGTTNGGGEILTLDIIDGTGTGTQKLKGGILLSILRDGTPNMGLNPYTANGPTHSGVANWNSSAISYTPVPRLLYLTLTTSASKDLHVSTMAKRFGTITGFGRMHAMS